MRRSLAEAQKALKGLVVMSPELEALTLALYDNQVRGRRLAGVAVGWQSVQWLVTPGEVAWPGGPGAVSCPTEAETRRPRLDTGARAVGRHGLPLAQAAVQLGGRPAGAAQVHRGLGGEGRAARVLDLRFLLPPGAWTLQLLAALPALPAVAL
jgi:hypothetical protein